MPKELFDEIRARSKSVSGFVAEAAAERPSRKRYQQAVAERVGAWSSEGHPGLNKWNLAGFKMEMQIVAEGF